MPTIPLALSTRSRSGGAVLAIVLIVLVVMMLGAVGLLRSVDTSALLSGNLAFKRESVNRSTVGLSAAFAQFKKSDFLNYADSNAGCDTKCTYTANWLAMNYSPRLLETDASGVPLILKDKTSFDAKFKAGTITDGNSEVRFVIERLCNDYGPFKQSSCMASTDCAVGGSHNKINDASSAGCSALPLYRVTVRSDVARNTQTYVQATMTTQVQQ